jgi:hypothetical protein
MFQAVYEVKISKEEELHTVISTTLLELGEQLQRLDIQNGSTESMVATIKTVAQKRELNREKKYGD